MSATERRRGAGLDGSSIALLGFLFAFLWAGLSMEGGLRLGYALAGQQHQVSGNPLVLAILAVRGKLAWPPAAIVCTAVLAVLLGVLIFGVLYLTVRGRPGRDVDQAARHMAHGRELGRLTRREVAAAAKRLHVQGGVVGLPIGRTVAGRTELLADWESTEVDIWGPRTGKTTSRAIPCVLDGPGPVVATSNRRDLVDATRDVRAERGQVWVFDPQQIVGELPSFAWNPLTYITSGPAGSEVKAQQLAGIFAAAVAPPDSKGDRFFDPKGQTLLGHLLHAATLDGRPITDVYRWVNRETDAEPARILDRHGFAMSADAVRGVIGSPDKQRGGIYGTAEGYIAFLTNRTAVEWITPGPGRPAFDPAALSGTADTLYLISREGRGTLAALTTALTAAVCEAAEARATRYPGGRLPVPMTVVLDEAANVCRWPDLPDLFSHYGGRGIYLLAILQSWAQGVEVWGPRAMAKLWSAATVRIYGGGASEVEFLREMAALIGRFRPQNVSTSTGRQGRSVSLTEGHEEILDVADLGALRRGRAILFASGARPTLIEPRPWFASRWAGAVRASIAHHDPAAAETLAGLPLVNPEPDVAPAGALFRGRTT